ncbi:GIY-YIG nuclease family protein [archaeon]|nr:GIY-YIG nuclease family protein [archaeon]NCQ51434.1 GIY-YIG nuclease family protein [archaeon]NCT58740.1 GIY-YIG nuclease family protein [archaeon]
MIYKILNVLNNKIYIGQTTQNIHKRFYQHCVRKNNYYLSNAIKKYGAENFIIEEIDRADSFDELNTKEIYYISYYNSTDNKIGYNISEGGHSPILRGEKNGMYGKTHSDEVKKRLSDIIKGKTWVERLGEEKALICKQKMSKNNLGSKRSEETKQKMSDNHWLKNKGYLIKGEKNPNFGHKWSEESRNKMRGENNPMYGKGLFGEKNPNFGKKYSDEIKAKMSLERSGELNARYIPITNEQLFLIKKLYEEGFSVPYISNQLNFKKGKISRELKKMNIYKKQIRTED